MRRGVLFKTKRIAEEWPSLFEPLRSRVVVLADIVNTDMNKPFTATCIYRSPDENKKVGGKTDSLHTLSPVRAIDIRTTTWVAGKPSPLYTTEETMRILHWWRQAGKGWDAVDEGHHLHLEADRRVK